MTKYLQPVLDQIPTQLRDIPRWVVWKDKKPFSPTQRRGPVDITNPQNWFSWDACAAAQAGAHWHGVGIVLNGDGLVGLDFDKCVEAGVPDPRALAILRRLGCTYVEVSPSGKGLRGFGRAHFKPTGKGVVDGIRVEVYSSGRYLTVTGHRVWEGEIGELNGFALFELLEDLSPNAPGAASLGMTKQAPPSALNRRETEDQQNTEEGTDTEVILPAGLRDIAVTGDLMPAGIGQRNCKIFDLARWAKARYPNAKASDLRPLVQDWHTQALPLIGTKDFAETWHDFVRAFDKVAFPAGHAYALAVARIDDTSLLPPTIESLGYGELTKRLVRLCRTLKDSFPGNTPFFLGCRTAGHHLGCGHVIASKLLKTLVLDGVLIVAAPHTKKKAIRYLMNEALWNHEPKQIRQLDLPNDFVRGETGNVLQFHRPALRAASPNSTAEQLPTAGTRAGDRQ